MSPLSFISVSLRSIPPRFIPGPAVRLAQIGAVTGLLFALGCSSTSPTPFPDTNALSEPTVATSEPVADAVPAPRVTLDPVYFETDQATLSSSARQSLKDDAKSILEHPEWGVVTIDGHCDERGSGPYNLALGSRRAAAVERYLVEMGVPRGRLSTRSFGSDSPAVPGHDEEAWRYNRRSEFRTGALASAIF